MFKGIETISLPFGLFKHKHIILPNKIQPKLWFIYTWNQKQLYAFVHDYFSNPFSRRIKQTVCECCLPCSYRFHEYKMSSVFKRTGVICNNFRNLQKNSSIMILLNTWIHVMMKKIACNQNQSVRAGIHLNFWNLKLTSFELES